ncbi:MAG: hypothetical protein Q8O52_05725 [Sulfuritalea sp.]|nr:hypothetical protein [Sulfuritalea sp.]
MQKFRFYAYISLPTSSRNRPLWQLSGRRRPSPFYAPSAPTQRRRLLVTATSAPYFLSTAFSTNAQVTPAKQSWHLLKNTPNPVFTEAWRGGRLMKLLRNNYASRVNDFVILVAAEGRAKLNDIHFKEMDMDGLKQASLALATAGLLASGVAQAALNDRGGGLIYDDVLDITW